MKVQLKKLFWIEEHLPLDVVSRAMHGGIGYYLDNRLILIVVDHGRSYEHKGVSYPFVIWNGCLIPVEPIKQSRVFMDFPNLENHPANKKWLYLAADTEDFEDVLMQLLREIKKRNPLFGLQMKSQKTFSDESEDLKKPRLFSEAQPVSLAKAKKQRKAVRTSSDQNKSVKKSTLKSASKSSKTNKKSENNYLLNVLNKSRSLK